MSGNNDQKLEFNFHSKHSTSNQMTNTPHNHNHIHNHNYNRNQNQHHDQMNSTNTNHHIKRYKTSNIVIIIVLCLSIVSIISGINYYVTTKNTIIENIEDRRNIDTTHANINPNLHSASSGSGSHSGSHSGSTSRAQSKSKTKRKRNSDEALKMQNEYIFEQQLIQSENIPLNLNSNPQESKILNAIGDKNAWISYSNIKSLMAWRLSQKNSISQRIPNTGQYGMPLTNKENKLQYCFIAKNACTKIKYFMAALNSYYEDIDEITGGINQMNKYEIKNKIDSNISHYGAGGGSSIGTNINITGKNRYGNYDDYNINIDHNNNNNNNNYNYNYNDSSNINSNINISFGDVNIFELPRYSYYQTFELNGHIHGYTDEIQRIFKQPKNLNELELISTDPDWTRFVIIRDPLERLLSGYLDKCKKFRLHWCELKDNPRYSSLIPKNKENKKESPIIPTFSQFIDNVEYKLNNNLPLNEHYIPQVYWCQLYKYFDNYQFVIKYDYDNLGEQFLSMLALLNLERFYFGWGKQRTDTLLHAKTHHSTNAAKYLKHYYTPKLARRVYDLYFVDYLLLNISYPSWIDDEWT